MGLLACSADVCLACVLGSKGGQDGGPVGSPETLDVVNRDGRLLCVSGSGGLVGLVQEAPDKVNEGGDAGATKGNGVGLGRDHGEVQVCLVLCEPGLQEGFVDIDVALEGCCKRQGRCLERGRTWVCGSEM